MAINDTYLTDIAHLSDLVKTATGDIATINGIPNLQNALFRRLITVPGALIHRPEYGVGINTFQNALNKLATQREIALRIQTQFERDPRVEKVTGVLVNYDQTNPSRTTIIVRIKPIGRDVTAMSFVPFGDA
jgi:phage baseplate assembly protein W